MIRTRRSLLVLTFAAGAAIAVAASQLPATSAPTLAPRMTATEIARGLLFDQGNAAHYLTALNRPEVRMTQALWILQRSVDRKLEEHPRLAATFARDVQSGNRVKVAVGLAILGRFTHQALTSEYGRATTRRIQAQAAVLLASPAAMAPNGSAGWSNFFHFVQGAAYIGLGVVAVAALIFALAVLIATERSSPDRLAAERVINLVAIGLQTAR